MRSCGSPAWTARDGQNRKGDGRRRGTRQAAAAHGDATWRRPGRTRSRQSVTLGFSLAAGGEVDLTVYLGGRAAGAHAGGAGSASRASTKRWWGRPPTTAERAVRAGVYFARLTAPQGRYARTLTYLK